MVVLPEPDSPISASTSPRAIEKLTSLTMVVSVLSSPRATTSRFDTSTRGWFMFHLDARKCPREARLSMSRFTPMVSVAMASAGMMTAAAPDDNPDRFSRTSDPQSA